jgi:hypothetical protein
MNRELTPLKALKAIGQLKENDCYINTTVEYKIVEEALKEYEMEHILRIRLENINYELVKRIKDYEKNEDFYKDVLIYAHLSEQDRIKKLKALEIIKENLIVIYDENKNDKPCLMLSIKVDKDKLITIYETFDKEKIDLLREVLK